MNEAGGIIPLAFIGSFIACFWLTDGAAIGLVVWGGGWLSLIVCLGVLQR